MTTYLVLTVHDAIFVVGEVEDAVAAVVLRHLSNHVLPRGRLLARKLCVLCRGYNDKLEAPRVCILYEVIDYILCASSGAKVRACV